MIQQRAIALVAALGFSATLGSAFSAKPTYAATDFKGPNAAQLTRADSFSSPLASPAAFALGVAAITGPLIVVTIVVYTATRPLPGSQAARTSTAVRLAKLDG